MGYTTFSEVIRWLEQPSGLTVRDDRDELVEIANDVRRIFYNLYEGVPLFMDAEECYVVKKYFRDCQQCDETYLGITLSPGMQTPEAAWVNRSPVQLYSKWRSTHVGIPPGGGNDCNLEAHDMGSTFPTFADIPAGACHHLKVMTGSPEDEAKGLEVRLTFVNDRGDTTTETLPLTRDYKRTEDKAKSIIAPGGIVIPSGLCGGVKVALDDGTIIGEYAPWQTVPAFRRLQVLGVCEGDQIAVRAARNFYPLCFDHDVVETDNKRAFVEGALFLRYSDSVNADQSYDQKALIHEERMRLQLLGEKSREFGKATVRKNSLSEGSINRSGLNSRRIPRLRHYGRTYS